MDTNTLALVLASAFGVVLSLGAQQWWIHKASQEERIKLAEVERRERERAAQKVSDAITKRDDKLMYVLKEHMPHTHCEDEDEPLYGKGIRYPKIELNGEDDG
jgi:hypothetical protein